MLKNIAGKISDFHCGKKEKEILKSNFSMADACVPLGCKAKAPGLLAVALRQLRVPYWLGNKHSIFQLLLRLSGQLDCKLGFLFPIGK